MQVDGAHVHISNEHAEVLWSRWTTGSLHDKGSRNGTFLDGRAPSVGRLLAAGPGRHVHPGAPKGPNLGFPFTLIDEAPPPATAHNTRTASVREALEGVLVLPDDEQPEVSIFEDAAGQLGRGRRGDVAPGRERRGDHRRRGPWWKLLLNAADKMKTLPVDGPSDVIERIALRIVVSQNEENHDLIVLSGGARRSSSRRPTTSWC